MVDNVPRVLAGRYEVGELIGRGGMAEVHIGRDTRLSRTVAIKLLRTDLAEDSTFHARFRREAQSAAALNHPTIVSVYDTGEEAVTDSMGRERTLPFIVMEYVEGHTVRELLKDGAAVPIEEAVEISIGVLGALEYAHNEGIVHRDIKPGNIMLTPTGQVKVMDFGIARAMADNAATMTAANSVVGTAQYLSPEQARGETVDQRSDVYSMACVLFELLTGRPPFQGDSPVSVAYQHVRELPPPASSIASDVPESLDRVLMKGLAKDRNERYQDAGEFRTDLLAIQHGGAISAPATTQWLPVGGAPAPGGTVPPTSVMPAGARPGDSPLTSTGTMVAARPIDDDTARQSRWWIWLLVLLGLLALAAGVWALMNQNGGPDRVPVPSVVGQDQATAAQTIEDANLIFVDGGTEVSDDVDAGGATRTDPPEGDEVDEGTEVTVYFSGGPDVVAIPDVLGMTAQQAKTALERDDFEFGIPETEDLPGVEEGRVGDTNPGVGEEYPRGTSVVVILGSGQVELIDLRGWEQADAENLLRDELLLQFRIEESESADVPAGQIVSTDPSPGNVPINQNVTLTVSSGTPNRAPLITGTDPVTVEAGQSWNPMAGVTATDPEDGDITSRITIVGLDDLNLDLPGTYTLVYQVEDSGGLTAQATRRVTVAAPAPPPATSPPVEPTQDPGNGGGDG